MIAFPRTLSLRPPMLTTANGRATLRLSGSARLPAGTAVRLYRGTSAARLGRSVTFSRTGSGLSGALRIAQSNKAQILFLQARAAIAAGTERCLPTFGVPCVRATRAAASVRSTVVRVTIPARKA